MTGRGRIGDAGRRAEREALRAIGAEPTVASGATDRGRGDGEVGEFLVEVKSTSGRSLSLKFEHLAEIERQALAIGKAPALQVVFMNGGGRPLRDGTWVAVPLRVFREVLEG